MQANGVADHQQQGGHQQQCEAEDEAVAELEDRRQPLDPEQVQLRLLHAGQLGQLLAQRLELVLVHLVRGYQDDAGQRVLRQLLERLAEAG